MALTVDIEKKLGSFRLSVKFGCDDGVLGLLGASGSGKSVTLKCIAGILSPDRGKIVLDGRTLFDSERHIDLPPQKRRVGYLFQSYALFPNMSVEQNIACAARDKNDVEALLRAMHLEALRTRRPRELSGGEQQRTALARILASKPSVLLLDEPFSALDCHLRAQVERETAQIIARFGGSVILVSHDREEVWRHAQNVAVLSGGSLDAIGPKREVFADPRTVNAAQILGYENISPVSDGRAAAFGLPLPNIFSPFCALREGEILLSEARGDGIPVLRAEIEERIEPSPVRLLLTLREDAMPLHAAIPMEKWLPLRGKKLQIQIPPAAIVPLREAKGTRYEENQG